MEGDFSVCLFGGGVVGGVGQHVGPMCIGEVQLVFWGFGRLCDFCRNIFGFR